MSFLGMGVQSEESNTNHRSILGIGILQSEESNTNHLGTGVFQCLAGVCLLYFRFDQGKKIISMKKKRKKTK